MQLIIKLRLVSRGAHGVPDLSGSTLCVLTLPRLAEM
jgi:hypothetical protein